MDKTFIAAEDLSREDWLRWRRNGVGGSDTAALLGLNSWRGPYTIYQEKVADMEPTDDLDLSKPGHEQAYWGRVLEDLVCKEFGLRTGNTVRELKVVTRNPKYPWLFATVDRFVWEQRPVRSTDVTEGKSAVEVLSAWGPPDALLECKTTTAWHLDDWMSGVPERALAQIQHYLAVTGLDHAYACALIGGQKFVHARVARDEAYIQKILEVTRRFWDRVERREPPPPDGKSSTGEIIDAALPVARPLSRVELPDNAIAVVGRVVDLKLHVKELTEELKGVENELKLALGEGEVGLFEGVPVATWKNEVRRSLDRAVVLKLLEELGVDPDEAGIFKETSTRVLRVRARGLEEEE